MALEPGFVPDGWTRGDPLSFVNKDFRYGPEMGIMRDVVYLPFDRTIAPAEVAGIRVHISESARAKVWLNWWNSDE